MRKIIVLSFISLDGVMQAPGGPDEDTSGGFRYGGWTVPHFDETLGEVMDEQIQPPFDLLLGRKTYDIFASYWPHQDEATSSIAKVFNAAKKYVVSGQSFTPEWHNSELVHDNVVAKIKELKQQDGPDLQVHGSSELIQTLLENDLVDELWLKIFPVTLGAGKRLFGDDTVPAAYTLLSSRVSSSGVIVANYKRAGDVETGSFA
jgi:dihydrofolate reductase